MNETVSELGKFIGQAFVVVFGWVVVHRLSTSRDFDKARREMVAKSADSLIESSVALLTDARAYHLATRNIPTELKIKMSLQDLAMRTNGLSEICADKPTLASCRTAIAASRRAITGLHFEDEHEAPLDESSGQLDDIADCVLRTKQCLLNLKHSQFGLR